MPMANSWNSKHIQASAGRKTTHQNTTESYRPTAPNGVRQDRGLFTGDPGLFAAGQLVKIVTAAAGLCASCLMFEPSILDMWPGVLCCLLGLPTLLLVNVCW